MEASRQPQHLAALERANQVRLARAKVREAVFAGEQAVAPLILEPPDSIVTLELAALIMFQRRWGRARTRRLLLSVGLPEQKTVGTLTPRQRAAVVEKLEKGPHGYSRPL